MLDIIMHRGILENLLLSTVSSATFVANYFAIWNSQEEYVIRMAIWKLFFIDVAFKFKICSNSNLYLSEILNPS